MATPANVNLLGESGILNGSFRTTWKIDLCFHSLRGSGAGSFATLCGSEGPNPVLFLSAARKMWDADVGDYEWQLGRNLMEAYAAVDKIACWGFRLAPPLRESGVQVDAFRAGIYRPSQINWARDEQLGFDEQVLSRFPRHGASDCACDKINPSPGSI